MSNTQKTRKSVGMSCGLTITNIPDKKGYDYQIEIPENCNVLIKYNGGVPAILNGPIYLTISDIYKSFLDRC